MSTKKVWFVTGASKGLGLALVQKLLAEGYKVAATSRSLKSFDNSIETSENFLPLEMDLLDENNVKKAISETVTKFGRVDVIVNNAGYGQLGTLEELTDVESRKNFDTNVFGSLNMIRQAMPYLRQQKSGYIINVASIGGITGAFPGWGVYCATKFAVAGFTESLAYEVAEFGINATVVYPGYFRTNFLDSGSMTLPENPIAEYTSARAVEAKHVEEINGNQPGDPEKAAVAFIELAEMQKPPIHFVMGTDAVGLAKDKMKALDADINGTLALSTLTDF
ncbi:SDR family NAD(P)-dependent oxidoreductase [Chryseobacterium sp.]|uniref:SDR family NAD(P)-dependent oxidoreductase n=1 Tax=Chryseobacterium sp. TaxID=1871047 RepID=UPI0028A20C33|nr:SDR family NAD(P)-dependent oxidoreductase [Chryseobacterium sp.]